MRRLIMALGQFVKTADFKTEKHAPVIKVQDTVQAGEKVWIDLVVGEDISHPNTVEHHIGWIKLYFVAEGTTLPYEVGVVEFNVHGEAAVANEGPVKAESAGRLQASFTKSGTLYAVSYCNIHGLWESEKQITVVA